MDFVILKVNGQDVSRASQEDAVRIFQEANEPIVIEALRRSESPRNTVENPLPQLDQTCGTCTVAVQTDLLGFEDYLSSRFSPGNNVWHEDLGTPGDDRDLIETILDDEMYDVFDDRMEYEEITLKREASNDPFGLTLFYIQESSDNTEEEEENVYIRSIESECVAGKNGRLREGDQLLQINGVEVRGQQQAEDLFRQSESEINLLVARLQLQAENFAVHSSSRKQEHGESAEETNRDVEEGVDLRCPSHHDSGVGLAADEEISSLPRTMESGNSDISKTGESSDSISKDILPSTGKKEKLSGTETSSSKSSLGSRLSGHSSTSSGRQVLDMDQELYMVHKKMDAIQLECEKLLRGSNFDPPEKAQWGESDTEHIYESINDSTVIEEPLYCSPYEAKKKTRPKVPKTLVRDQNPEMTSCAIRNRKVDRSSEVCEWLKTVPASPRESRTTEWPDAAKNLNLKSKSVRKRKEVEPPRMTFNISPGLMSSRLVLCQPPAKPERIETQFSDRFSVVSCETCRNCVQLPTPGGIPVFLGSRESRIPTIRTVTGSGRNTHPPSHTSHTMYTNAANLQHTISVQQRIFKENLQKNGKIREELAPDADPLEMEWRIKRRPDGTRYISRRTVRGKSSSDRAKQECCLPGDCGSEMDHSRWTKRDQRLIAACMTEQRERRQERSKSKTQPWLQSNCLKTSRSIGKPNIGKKVDECILSSQRQKHTLADGILSVTTV